jgi:putative RNA 2'-phosphotransferase
MVVDAEWGGIMNNNEKIKASRFLSFILRHHPEAINLTLDNGGWASVQHLLDNIQRTKHKLTFEQLKNIVDTDEKRRYLFNEDYTKIRASQGHSIKVDLNLAQSQPPDILYHGTATQYIEIIKKQGLKKMSRQYVYLSKDEKTATEVGARRRYPVVVIINAKNMFNDGYAFYLSHNEIWLTESVPAEYIQSFRKF